jgi:hypothetical protein
MVAEGPVADSLILTFSFVDDRRVAALLPHWQPPPAIGVRHGPRRRRLSHRGGDPLPRDAALKEEKPFKMQTRWRAGRRSSRNTIGAPN